jgi:hypothetical protein
MRSAREHHEEAERLLEEAHTTHDHISRSLILAEAQVHATLALSAPAGKDPPGPGQDEAADTRSTGTVHQAPPSPSPGTPTSTPQTVPGSREREGNQPVRPIPVPLPDTHVRTRSNPEPHAENPAQPAPGPLTGQPGPGDPGKEKPGDLGDQKPRGPEEQKPGGLRPLQPATGDVTCPLAGLPHIRQPGALTGHRGVSTTSAATAVRAGQAPLCLSAPPTGSPQRL